MQAVGHTGTMRPLHAVHPWSSSLCECKEHAREDQPSLGAAKRHPFAATKRQWLPAHFCSGTPYPDAHKRPVMRQCPTTCRKLLQSITICKLTAIHAYRTHGCRFDCASVEPGNMWARCGACSRDTRVIQWCKRLINKPPVLSGALGTLLKQRSMLLCMHKEDVRC